MFGCLSTHGRGTESFYLQLHARCLVFTIFLFLCQTSIAEELGILDANAVSFSEAQWKAVIIAVRTRWGGKYAWTPESHGQDDVAELLGDILYRRHPGNFAVTGLRLLSACGCQHSWERRMPEMMAVLNLPPRDAFEGCRPDCGHSITALLEHRAIVEEIDDLHCDVCQLGGQHGESSYGFEFDSEVVIFRINRYEVVDGIETKRRDVLQPEMRLPLHQIEYDLVAVVEHSGDNVRSGHYQAIVRADSGWAA